MISRCQTRYALSGDVSIAYQVMGDAPIDIIMVPGIVSHVEFLHELPGYTAFLRRLAASRVSSRSISEGKDCQTECLRRHRSKNGWMTFAPSWTTLVPDKPFFWDFPKARR